MQCIGKVSSVTGRPCIFVANMEDVTLSYIKEFRFAFGTTKKFTGLGSVFFKLHGAVD